MAKKSHKIISALFEAIWISRWTDKDRQALVAVLTDKEAQQIVDNIFKELDNAGYEIVKKEEKK